MHSEAIYNQRKVEKLRSSIFEYNKLDDHFKNNEHGSNNEPDKRTPYNELSVEKNGGMANLGIPKKKNRF